MATDKPFSATPAKRHKARHYGLQALYQWCMTGADAAEIIAQFRTDYDFSNVDADYFAALVQGGINQAVQLDQQIQPLLDRPLEELDPVEHSLLRLSGYELAERIDVPYKVVINEAVALAKKFGATDGHKFINGVLDKLALQLRQAEVQHARS